MSASTYQQSCPNPNCEHFKVLNAGNLQVHSQQNKRLRCKSCGKTWVQHKKSLHYGLRKDPLLVIRATQMLEAQVPIRSIARQLKVNPSTVQRWKKRKQKLQRSQYLNNHS